MQTIVKLIKLFTPTERRRLIPLTAAVLFMALVEIVGISSLGPFLAVVADPGVIETNALLAAVYEAGGFASTRAFLIALGVGVFAMVLTATAVKVITLYAVYRYVGNRRYTLSLRLFRQYIYQPYSFYLNHNTSELSKNLLTEIDQVINGVLRPAADTFAHGALALGILTFLIVLNPFVALVAAVVFGGTYGLLYGLIRPLLARYGREVREANRLRFKAAGEAFGAVKDVKILGKEPSYGLTFGFAARWFARTQVARQVLTTLPSYVMQAVPIGFGVGLVIILLAYGDGTLAEVLPLLGVYGFAVQRMMPSLQHVFRGFTQMRYYAPMVDALYADMTEMPAAPSLPDKKLLRTAPPVMPFGTALETRGLAFSYPGAPAPVLADINLRVEKNTTVGLVGTTGCGKTTLVDVLMGLLEPTEGAVVVDGTPVNPAQAPDTLRAWQRNFGYVPQQIYLSDDTVAANIAFGIPQDHRDPEAIEHAARVANLHEFVISELPEGYDTVVGERGIRLSGGQRQRVGIARALYHDPAILVMDEATSALDSVTEEAVMDAIRTLMHTKTIVLIAHRITTVQECDVIYLLERGRVVAAGGYRELIEENERFRAMAKVAG